MSLRLVRFHTRLGLLRRLRPRWGPWRPWYIGRVAHPCGAACMHACHWRSDRLAYERLIERPLVSWRVFSYLPLTLPFSGRCWELNAWARHRDHALLCAVLACASAHLAAICTLLSSKLQGRRPGCCTLEGRCHPQCALPTSATSC